MRIIGVSPGDQLLRLVSAGFKIWLRRHRRHRHRLDGRFNDMDNANTSKGAMKVAQIATIHESMNMFFPMRRPSLSYI